MKMRAHLAKENCASLPESHIRPNDNNFASLFFVEIINYSNKAKCWRKENGTQSFVQVMMPREMERGKCGHRRLCKKPRKKSSVRSLAFSLFPYLPHSKNATRNGWAAIFSSFEQPKKRLVSFSKASLWLSKRTDRIHVSVMQTHRCATRHRHECI